MSTKPDGIQELFSQVEELRQDLTKAHDEVDNYKELAGLYKDKSSKDKEALELKNRDHVSLESAPCLPLA